MYGIFTNICPKNQYTSTMEHMGYIYIYTAQNGVKRDPTIPLIPLLCLVNVHDLPSGYD